MAAKIVLLALLAVACSHALASDPSQLQDFCVADMNSAVIVNEYPCKNATKVTADDFFTCALGRAGNTTNVYGSNVKILNVTEIPAINTLGVTMGRIDYGCRGINPLHYHPRATEVLVVLQGILSVGVVTSGNALFTKTLYKGDVFVFPEGLIHFQQNLNCSPALAIIAFGSQNPGRTVVAENMFGSTPLMNPDFLAKVMRITRQLVLLILSLFKGDGGQA